MPSSTLDVTEEGAAVTDRGHGTRALGPSDSSDSGSDVVGGPGMDEGLSDEQARRMPETLRSTAGRDLGDVDLASDSDRSGTGERGSSGVGSDPVDQSLTIEGGDDADWDALDDPTVPLDRIASLSDESSDPRDDGGDESGEAPAADDGEVSDGAT